LNGRLGARRWSVLAAGVVVLAGAVPRRLARADDPVADVADVGLVSPGGDAAALLDAVETSLRDLGLQVHTSAALDRESFDATSSGRVRLWVDARAADHVEIVATVPDQGGAHSVMRVIARGESNAVLVDQVAYVVRATVASMLLPGGPPPSAPPPSSPSPAPPPPAAPLAPVSTATLAPTASKESVAVESRRSSALALDAEAFGQGRALGSAPLLGGGGGVDVAPWGLDPWRPRGWLSGAIFAPIQSRTDLVTLETSIVSLRALVDVAMLRAGPLSLGAGVGGGIDVARSVPVSTSAPSVTLGDASTLVDPIVEGRLLAVLSIPGGPSILAAFDLDVDVEPHRYDTLDANHAETAVFDPWHVRPGMTLGLSIPVLASGGGTR
jgi:hypothetical protein